MGTPRFAHDERDLAEIESPDYPGERLVVCRNPALAEERARKRAELLDATEDRLRRIQARVRRSRRPLWGADKIGIAVGAVVDRCKMAKHFAVIITDDDLTWTRKHAAIAAEAALDGLYVLRTSVAADALDTTGVVAGYKRLATVERTFRSHKTVDLEVRPIPHRRSDRIRAHVFLCRLADHLEWHMRRALAPMLFDDHDKAAADAERTSIVAPAIRSAAARRKAASKRTDDGLPVLSFRSRIDALATVTHNTMAMPDHPDARFVLYLQFTPLQARAFQLLGTAVKNIARNRITQSDPIARQINRLRLAIRGDFGLNLS